MRWVLLDVVLVLAGLTLLALVTLRLWGRVKGLARALERASEQVSAVTAQLETVQQPRPDPVPTPAGHVSGVPKRSRGVGS